MPTLTVNTGPLKGRTFECLMEFLEEQQLLQENCHHARWEPRRIITGRETGHPKLVTGKVCICCGLRFDVNATPLAPP